MKKTGKFPLDTRKGIYIYFSATDAQNEAEQAADLDEIKGVENGGREGPGRAPCH